jgi:DNA (cytosine-5)-methyltransferase 1
MQKGIIYETVGELFCGPGGGALGASMSSYENKKTEVRMKHLWATDYDLDSCKTYLTNIARYEREHHHRGDEVKVIHADINSDDVDLRSAEQFPAVDGLMFGFPCNDFSVVGESKGLNGKFGPLYKHGIRILNRADKPKWFIAENVSGLSSSNNGAALKQIEAEMRQAGYTIKTHKYKFEEYGLPQSRHRIIIVGFRNDLDLSFKVPPASKTRTSAREALKNIPENASHQELTRQSKNVVERLKYIKPGQNAWNAEIPKHLQLNVPNVRLSHIYKRLDPDKPAYTVTGSGGGGTHMYHWDQPRALTNRERARLQTFPDWYNFSGSKENVRKQIGMAIPPLGIKIICDSLLKCLYNKKID